MHVFDIIGPIMIGPSSSHTAGAARIGRVARRLLGEAPVEAQIGLFGSFAATAKGHGTDRALVAGLLDMDVDDPRLRDSLEIAKASGLAVTFTEVFLRDAHPNTAVITARGAKREVSLRAASIGGGAIRVESLAGLPVSFSGGANTLVVEHTDRPGVIANASGLLAYHGLNIATMQVSREKAGGWAVMVIETDAVPDAETLETLSAMPDIRDVSFLRAG